MPAYTFVCLKCEHEYEELVEYSENGKYPKIKCPKCNSKKKRRRIGLANFTFAQPVGTDRYNNSHDYRFKHKLPKVKEERKVAELMSHMGKDPYNDQIAKDLLMDTGVHDMESRPGLS